MSGRSRLERVLATLFLGLVRIHQTGSLDREMRPSRSILIGLISAVLHAAGPSAAWGQDQAGTGRSARDSSEAVLPGVAVIAGRVIDDSGAVIVGANVTVTGAGGISRHLVSDERGAFLVAGLAAGDYLVHVERTQFNSFMGRVRDRRRAAR